MHIMGSDAFEWMGTVYRIMLGAGETGGKVAVFESVTGPGGGPPLHRHGDADETFVVLSGDVEFCVDGVRTVRGPGQTAFAPKGSEHGFRVCDHAPARMLTMLSPGGFEAFFREVYEAGYRLPEDMERVCGVGKKFQLDFTGPPMSGREATRGG